MSIWDGHQLDIDTEQGLVSVTTTYEPKSNIVSVHPSKRNLSGSRRIVQGSWQDGVVALISCNRENVQGVVPAVQAVVRMSQFLGAKLFYVKGGFQGLLQGEAAFQEVTQHNIKSLGSDEQRVGQGRSSEASPPMDWSDRRRAALSLVGKGVSNLVVIGGEPALRAIHDIYSDWNEILRCLMEDGDITRNQCILHLSLRVAHVVTSATYDVLGTDYSIGYDSALQRVLEVTDVLTEMPGSSGKAFVVEVMCGHLALAAGLGTDASMVFYPERPPDGDWRKVLSAKIKSDLTERRSYLLVFVTEGMCDVTGAPITSGDVAECMNKQHGLSASVIVLGDIQRGGRPSVQDRLYAIRCGAAAVTYLQDIQSERRVFPMAVGVFGTKLTRVAAEAMLEMTDRHRYYLKELRSYDEANRLLPPTILTLQTNYQQMEKMHPAVIMTLPGLAEKQPVVGVLRVGQMTMYTSLLTLLTKANLSRGYNTVGFHKGFEGLVSGDTVTVDWGNTAGHNDHLEVSQLSATEVGLAKIAHAIVRHNIRGLIIIGDFVAFKSLHELWVEKDKHRGLLIPMCCVPCCSHNNVPGSENSIGSGNAAIELTNTLDKLKFLSRKKKRIFHVVETPGGDSDYLARVCGLCAGADAVYTKANPPNLDILLKDAESIKEKYERSPHNHGMVIRSANSSENYTTEFMVKIFTETGKGLYICERSIFCDANMEAVSLGCFNINNRVASMSASKWITDQVASNTGVDGTVASTRPESKSVMCINRLDVRFKEIRNLVAEADFDQRKSTFLWWETFNNLLPIMKGHYGEGVAVDTEDIMVPEWSQSQ